jgi:lipopolysaccharide transport system permease protein
MAGLLVGYDVTPGIGLLLLPLWLVIALMMAVGLGLVVSGLAVRYRDVQHLVPLMSQLLLFASPIAYSVSSVPESLRSAFRLNPLAGLFEAVRWSLLRTGDLDVGQAVYAGGFAVAILCIGALIFTSLERDFADVI